MNLVFARHSNDERVRLFRVCDGETLKHGQKIIVRTRRGTAEAIVSGDSFETTDGTANIIAVKRVERLNLHAAMEQSIRDAKGDIPIVVHRMSREPWMVTMRFEDFMTMFRDTMRERL